MALLTAEEVVDSLMSDEEEDYDFDDPDEPMMPDSDDEFSDLEVESDEEDNDDDQDNAPDPSHTPAPGSSSQQSPSSPDWSSTLKPVTLNSFQSHVGPTVTIPDSPLKAFELFFSSDLQNKIVDESNRYAEQVMGGEKFAQWNTMSQDELKAYLGFNILMGMNKLPSVEDYWSRNPLFHYSPVGSRISRDRFRDLSRYLHFTDNDTLAPRGSPDHDRLGKVRPVVSHMAKKFKETYDPNMEVAVDEAMIKFQGRSTLKQYMPMKPVKRGIKVWVLGDSQNGYFSSFQVYTGKEGNTTEKGLGKRVVKDLTEDLKGKHHHVYFDNFFTSLDLIVDLDKDGIYSCGTARKDRKGFPPALKKPKLPNRCSVNIFVSLCERGSGKCRYMYSV